MTIAFSAGDLAYGALAIFLVLLGVGSLFALYKLGQLFGRVSSFIRGTERDLLPVIVKTGGTVDRVNYQLDKLDTVTDSAVSMADSADTAVRAVSTAIAKPVEKVSGVAAGIAHGVSSLRKTRNVSDAMDAAKDAARRREQDLAEDLRVAGRTPPSSERPAPTPTPEPTPKPDPWPQPAPTPRPEPAPSRQTSRPAAARATAWRGHRVGPPLAPARGGWLERRPPSPTRAWPIADRRHSGRTTSVRSADSRPATGQTPETRELRLRRMTSEPASASWREIG